MARLQAASWTYTIGVRQQPHMQAAIAAIPEQDWQTLEDYPEEGEAQIAHHGLRLGHIRRLLHGSGAVSR
jgi:hypothetical protein